MPPYRLLNGPAPPVHRPARERDACVHTPAGWSLVRYIQITPVVTLPVSRVTRVGGGRWPVAGARPRRIATRSCGRLAGISADGPRGRGPGTRDVVRDCVWAPRRRVAYGTCVRGGPATPITCAARRGGGHLGERSASPVAVAGGRPDLDGTSPERQLPRMVWPVHGGPPPRRSPWRIQSSYGGWLVALAGWYSVPPAGARGRSGLGTRQRHPLAARQRAIRSHDRSLWPAGFLNIRLRVRWSFRADEPHVPP